MPTLEDMLYLNRRGDDDFEEEYEDYDYDEEYEYDDDYEYDEDEEVEEDED